MNPSGSHHLLYFSEADLASFESSHKILAHNAAFAASTNHAYSLLSRHPVPYLLHVLPFDDLQFSVIHVQLRTRPARRNLIMVRY